MKFNEALSASFLGIGVALLFLMVLMIFAGVVARGVLNSSIPWTGEASVISLLWMTFLGSVVGYRRKMFPAFTSLVDALPERRAKGLRVLVLGVNVLAALGLLVVGLNFALNSMRQSSPVLGISLGWVYLAIPVAGAAMVPISLELIIAAVRGQAVVSRAMQDADEVTG